VATTSAESGLPRAFWGLPRAFWGLWIGTVVAWSGRTVLPFLALYFTHEAHYSAASAGAIVSLYGLGGVVAVLLSGPLIDRIGPRSVILWSLCLSAAVAALMAAVPNIVVIILMVPLLGASTQAVGPSVNVLATLVVSDADRRRAFALMYVALNAGFSLGPALGGFLAQLSYRLIFVGEALTMVAAAGICAATIPGATTARTPDGPMGVERRGVMFALTDRVFITFVGLNLLFIIVYVQNLTVTLPLVLSGAGFRPAQYGLLLTINGLMLVILQVPIDRALKRVQLSLLLVLGAGILGCGVILQAWAVSWGMYAACVAVWTLGELLNMPTANTVASHLAPPHLLGRYMGILAAGFPIAALIAPVTGGVMLQSVGASKLMIFSGGIALAAMMGRMATARRTEARLQPQDATSRSLSPRGPG
jgi:MFS family permease